MMRIFAAAAAAMAVVLAFPAAAQIDSENGNGGGQQTKVCLLTFSSASGRQSGSDAAVTDAQYVPLPMAVTLKKDKSTQAIAYYGFGPLTAEDQAVVDFYYPNGSSDPALGVTQTADTQTLCNAFAAPNASLEKF